MKKGFFAADQQRPKHEVESRAYESSLRLMRESVLVG